MKKKVTTDDQLKAVDETIISSLCLILSTFSHILDYLKQRSDILKELEKDKTKH